jgi:hypothetical protein
MTNKLLMLFIILGITYTGFGQEEEEVEKNEEEDKFEIFEDDDSFELDFDDEFEFFSLKRQPMVKINAGIANPNYLGQDFGEVDHFKFIFGFSKVKDDVIKRKDKNDIILREYEDNGLLIESYNHRSDVLSDYIDDSRQFSMLKFGYSMSEGNGYKLGENAEILLMRETGFGWQKLDYSYGVGEDSPGVAGNIDPRLKLNDTYGSDVRFSSYYQAGIKIKPISSVSIDFGFQQDLVYSRYMFWHAAASGIVEVIAEGIAEKFANKIQKSSPYVGPIAHFVLKNAISYAFMELRKKDMNWPISSADALIINSMNLGVSFHF